MPKAQTNGFQMNERTTPEAYELELQKSRKRVEQRKIDARESVKRKMEQEAIMHREASIRRKAFILRALGLLIVGVMIPLVLFAFFSR